MNKVSETYNDDLIYEVGINAFLSPIKDLLTDDSISEVIVLGADNIYIERAGKLEQTTNSFPSETALMAAVNTITQFCGKTITDDTPIVDGHLPDGSRVCIVLPPVTSGKISLNIRKFSQVAKTPDFLLKVGSATEQALEFMELATKAKLNIIVSGGTGSGKTTLLNIMSSWFDPSHRIIVIEDTREIQLQQEHVVSMQARANDEFGHGEVTIRDMFVASLRMRPDRIIVGEIRRAEAVDVIQAMNSGHGGTMATVHADSPFQACSRLEVMALMAELGLPVEALRRQIAEALNLVVQTSRLYDGRRCITHISEVGFDHQADTYLMKDIFRLERSTAGNFDLVWTGQKLKMLDKLELFGLQDAVKLTAGIWE